MHVTTYLQKNLSYQTSKSHNNFNVCVLIAWVSGFIKIFQCAPQITSAVKVPLELLWSATINATLSNFLTEILAPEVEGWG